MTQRQRDALTRRALLALVGLAARINHGDPLDHVAMREFDEAADLAAQVLEADLTRDRGAERRRR